MDYKKASEIRKKGLISLIAENKFQEGKGLGASIGGAISQKFKAKAVGVKESFDPLNIISKMTGKGTFGRIATTIAGRAMGKSEKDIGYFGGYAKKRKHHYVDTNVSPMEYDEGAGRPSRDPIASILGEMYQFMQQTHEVDKKDFEIQQAFLEEQNSDAETRHKQLVRAIKKYIKVPSKAEEKTEGGGMLDFIMDFIKKIKDEIMSIIQPVLDFFGKIGNSALSLAKFLIGSPAALAAILYAIGLYKAKEFLDETKYGERMKEGEGKIAQKAFKEKKTDFSHMPLNKDEAKAILEQTETPGKKRDIESFGGIERIQAIADGKPDPGGISLQKPVDNTTPTNKTKKFEETKAKVSETSPSTLIKESPVSGTVVGEKSTVTSTPNFPTNETTTTSSQSVPIPQIIPKSANLQIPEQVNPETNNTTNGQPVVAMNSTTNNIGGGPAKVFNMDSVKVRNIDLNSYLRKSTAVV